MVLTFVLCVEAEYCGKTINIFIRTVQVIREIFTLRYSRCSNGWKSVAADIFLF